MLIIPYLLPLLVMEDQQVHKDLSILRKKVELLEQKVEILRTKDDHPSQNLLERLNAIDIALKEQFNAVQSFMLAFSTPLLQPHPTLLSKDTIIPRYQLKTSIDKAVHPITTRSLPAALQTATAKVDASTQTNVATAPPSHMISTPPPPVKTRQMQDKTRPSLLRQSSSASDRTHSNSSTPLSARLPSQANAETKQNTDDNVTLRQRKVAFAAQHQAHDHAPNKKASAQSLAIEAAKREVARAAARAAHKAKEEKYVSRLFESITSIWSFCMFFMFSMYPFREKNSSGISWIIHMAMILLGVGALFLGIIMVVAYRARQSGHILR